MRTTVTELRARGRRAAAFRAARAQVEAEKNVELRQSVLSSRAGDCWDRIEDAVVELICVHEVSVEQILFHVKRTVAAERDRVE